MALILNFELFPPFLDGFQGNLTPPTNNDHHILETAWQLSALLQFSDDITVDGSQCGTTGRGNEDAVIVGQMHTRRHSVSVRDHMTGHMMLGEPLVRFLTHSLCPKATSNAEAEQAENKTFQS